MAIISEAYVHNTNINANDFIIDYIIAYYAYSLDSILIVFIALD